MENIQEWILCIFWIICSTSSLAYPIVEVEDGKIQGYLVKPDDGKSYYAFKEIPYAAPPIGDLRFAEPIPPQKWIGVKDTMKNTKVCNSQKVTFLPPEDQRENEDCLYLNVFTPQINESHKTLLPVYIYIYGGMFIMGEPTEYNFQGFLDEDIVVVTMNFRSPLGFVATGDNVIPGNIGLKDQLLAIKWVNKNIVRFGGDPSKVTIGGHSSGGVYSGYHLLNTKAKGLFRSVIMQSGSPLSTLSYIGTPKYFAYALGKKLSPDFTSQNTSEDLLKLLRSVPVEKILETFVKERFIQRVEFLDTSGQGMADLLIKCLVELEVDTSKLSFQSYDFANNMAGRFKGVQKRITDSLGHLVPYIPCQGHRTNTSLEHSCNYPDWFDYPVAGFKAAFGPVTEDSDYENAVVIGPMHDNFEKGISNHIPVLTGITAEEFIRFHNATAAALLVDANLTNMLDPALRIKPENFLPMAKELKEIYSKEKPFRENVPGFVKAMTDIYFAMPFINTAYLHSKYSDVYFYQFSYKTRYNGIEWEKEMDWCKPGVIPLAGHTDELPLLYDYRLNPGVDPTIEDLNMKKKIIKLWTNFIKYTNPTPTRDPLFQNITWPKVKQGNFSYLDINSNLSIMKNPRKFLDWQNRIEKYFDSPRYSY